MNYFQFRQNALASLSMTKSSDYRFNSLEDKEDWIKKEYDRHYNKKENKNK